MVFRNDSCGIPDGYFVLLRSSASISIHGLAGRRSLSAISRTKLLAPLRAMQFSQVHDFRDNQRKGTENDTRRDPHKPFARKVFDNRQIDDNDKSKQGSD